MPDSENRREVTATVTEQDSALVGEVSAQHSADLAGAMGRISAEDRAVLHRAFSSFADGAGEPALADMLVLGI